MPPDWTSATNFWRNRSVITKTDLTGIRVQSATLHKTLDGLAVYADYSANGSVGNFLGKKLLDLFLLTGQFGIGGQTAFWPAQFFTLTFPSGKSFFGTLGNKLSFDFGGKRKSKGQYLGADIISQFVLFLDGMYLNILFHTGMQNTHYFH